MRGILELFFMNKILITFIFATIISVSLFAAPPDVSNQLDTYDEVLNMIEIGIMNVDNRGYFHGTNSVNRYELADTLFQLRENILGSKVFKEVSGVSGKVIRIEEEVASNNVSIDKLRTRIDILEVSLSKEELNAIEQRLFNLKDEVLVQLQTLDDKTSFITGYSDFLSAVERELENLYSQVEEQDSRLAANEANVSRLIEYLRIYGDLDKWMKKMEDEDTALHNSDKNIMGEIDGLKKRIDNLEFLGQEVLSFRTTMEAAVPALELAARIPEIEGTLGNFNQRITNLESIGSAVNKVAQDNDYLKIENDRLKQEMTDIKKQMWYAIGIGVAGAALSSVALVYSFMNSSKTTVE
jgi:chromosome segregation ATPase